MELSQQQYDWLVKKMEEEAALVVAVVHDNKVSKARGAVAKKYEKRLAKLAEEGKTTERALLIEEMTTEAQEAENAIQ